MSHAVKLAASITPAAAAVLAAHAGSHGGFQLPTPFLSIFACVTFAGAINGRVSGTIAGIIAGLYVVHCFMEGYGPPKLTGGPVQTILGTTLYIATGFLIGLIRDQRDIAAARLIEVERERTARETAALQKTLDQNEALFEQALNVAGIGLWTWNIKDDRCEFCSELGSKMNGLTPDEFIDICSSGEGSLGLIHPDSRVAYNGVIEQVERGHTVNHEYKGLKKNGDTIFVRETLAPIRDDNGQVIKIIGTSINITDQRQTEMQLRQAQKMEAVGQLTAGISHDFNNLLAVILGNLELINLKANDLGVRANVDLALKATDRGAKLTQQLLAYSRQVTMDKIVLDPNGLIRDMDDLLRRSLPATIQIETVLSGGLWPIEVDRTQLESALLNLAINARDAMPDGGKITVETANIRLDDNYRTERGLEIPPGRYVLIAVSDTGTGMPPETLEHAMNPFFTTKPPGQGSGLGLAMVYGFAKQSGGHIAIYSEPDHGTTVKLYFPESSGLAQPDEHSASEPEVQSAGSACILVVEDTEDVRSVIVAQLEEFGYETLQAQDADTALLMLRSKSKVDLLLSDVVMPGALQGPELVQLAMKEFPGLKAVLMSGYSKSAIEHGNGAAKAIPKLTKPVQMAELGTVVGRALLHS